MRQDNTQHHGDVKRSLDQLASIISSGDLEKIIQLAKDVKGEQCQYVFMSIYGSVHRHRNPYGPEGIPVLLCTGNCLLQCCPSYYV